MTNIYKLFSKLRQYGSSKKDKYFVTDIPGLKNHKLGISTEGSPMFFILSKEINLIYLPIELGISVQFGLNCKLTDGKKQMIGNYTIITLKSYNEDLLSYFLDIIYVVIKGLPSIPTLKNVKSEIDKLIELFSNLSKAGTSDIQGLCAELMIIERARNPDYMVASWHSVKNDLFDFNDGKDKIEVKSTSKSERIHSFSLNQLNPNLNSKLIIGSVFIIKTGKGKNIFDLIDLISKRLNNNSRITFARIISEIMGEQINKATDFYFDYANAKDRLAFYNVIDIPKLQIDQIPIEVSNVHFDCNLSKVKEFKVGKVKSHLFQSL